MNTQTESRRVVAPHVDVFENSENIRLMADMPGVAKEGLSVKVHNDELSIIGQRGPSPEGEALHRGIRLNDFHRTFALHETIDAENIEAILKNGVLTVILPKSDTVKNRHIEIQT